MHWPLNWKIWCLVWISDNYRLDSVKTAGSGCLGLSLTAPLAAAPRCAMNPAKIVWNFIKFSRCKNPFCPQYYFPLAHIEIWDNGAAASWCKKLSSAGSRHLSSCDRHIYTFLIEQHFALGRDEKKDKLIGAISPVIQTQFITRPAAASSCRSRI